MRAFNTSGLQLPFSQEVAHGLIPAIFNDQIRPHNTFNEAYLSGNAQT